MEEGFTPNGQKCLTIGDLKRALETMDDALLVRIAMTVPASDEWWYGYVMEDSLAANGIALYMQAEGEHQL